LHAISSAAAMVVQKAFVMSTEAEASQKALLRCVASGEATF
jgi:hypothetical protein